MKDADGSNSKTLDTVAEIIFFCAVLIAVGSTVVALVLIGSGHTLVWPGIGVAVGGYMFATLFAAVGHIARAVGHLVAQTELAPATNAPAWARTESEG